MKLRIGDHLVAAGVLTEQQLAAAIQIQKTSGGLIGEILVEKGWVTEKEVLQALSQMFDVPIMELEDFLAAPDVCGLFKLETLKQWKFFPVSLRGDVLTVAGTNPLDVNMLNELKYLSGYKISLVLATSQEIGLC